MRKNLITEPPSVTIYGVECSAENLLKVLGVFDCGHVLVTVDSVAAESTIIASGEGGVPCFVKPSAGNRAELSAVVPCGMARAFLEKAIAEEPENIFVFVLPDPANAADCFA